MAQTENTNVPQSNGMYIRGLVLSATARVFKKKDNSGYNVKVIHEIAVQPGVVLWEAFHDPQDGQVKLQGEEVVQFPRLADFTPVALKFKRFREFNNQLSISDVEVVA